MRDVRAILNFWFAPGMKPRWFKKDPEFDAEIARQFLSVHERAAKGELAEWQGSPEGALALVLLLDQFPRNLFRGTARAFATDAEARAVAAWAVDRDFDLKFADNDRRIFFYLPFEHSENLDDQYRCLELLRTRCQDADYIRYGLAHFEVIKRFGRFPHRNAALGRPNTAAEEDYLAKPGSGF
jgi:uncharacterized protein (DUF924 family)